MPLSSTDIVFYYTGTGSTLATTLSLGTSISLNTIPDNTAQNVYDDVTGDESSSGDIEYRGIAIKDTNTIFTMINPKIWITGYLRAASGADTISIARSTFALTSQTMGVCANESSTMNETGMTWYSENASSSTLPSSTIDYSPGTLTATYWFGLWLKREVPVSATAYNNRTCTIRVQCETTASPYTQTVTTHSLVTV